MYAEKLIGNRRTPIPKVDREVTKANGEVIPYFLTPEEIAEKFKGIKPLKEKPPIGLRAPTSEEQKERGRRRFKKEIEGAGE